MARSRKTACKRTRVTALIWEISQTSSPDDPNDGRPGPSTGPRIT